MAAIFDRSKDPMAAYARMAPDYIQHNPIVRRIGAVNGVSGRDEFKLLIELMNSGVEGPPPPIPGQPPETFDQVMADCNHAFLLKKSWMPDPQNPGKFYPVFDFDFWRIENRKLAEHWDGARIPPRLPRAMTTPAKQLYEEAKAKPVPPKP